MKVMYFVFSLLSLLFLSGCSRKEEEVKEEVYGEIIFIELNNNATPEEIDAGFSRLKKEFEPKHIWLVTNTDPEDVACK